MKHSTGEFNRLGTSEERSENLNIRWWKQLKKKKNKESEKG